MNLFVLFKGLLILALLAFGGFILRLTQLDTIFNEAWIDTDIRGSGIAGELLFVIICGIATAIGLPRQIVSFLSGYAFGFVLGTCLALLATTIGCVTTFSYARLFGQNFVKARFKNRLHRIDHFLSENPFSMTLLIRFLPAGSNLVTSLSAGVSSVPAFPFFAGSAIGFIPQTAIFSLAGSGVTVDQFYTVLLSAVLFVISALLGFYLYRKFRHGKKLGKIGKFDINDNN